MTERVQELVERFNSLLPSARSEESPSNDFLTVSTQWSEAVWKAAEREGPLSLSEEIIERGVTLVQHPIHIFGVHRSGTTLVRDLLDGHPAVCILPSEGSFFTNTQKHLRKLPLKKWLKFVGCEWLRRLANPINQPPYWLLGADSERNSPYLFFARALMGWWNVLEEQLPPVVTQKPLLAVVLAYAYARGNGTLNPQIAQWGEKTPTNEKFLDQVWKEFPSAKIVHVVRHPFAVYASRKKLEERVKHSVFNPRRTLKDMASSYRIALEHRNQSENYFLLKFEDLLENPSDVMERLAAFLRIEFLPTLLTPTIAGIPSLSNSSFHRSDVRGHILKHSQHIPIEMLTTKEQELLSAGAGYYAKLLGYNLTE